jgi:hypothetical protein
MRTVTRELLDGNCICSIARLSTLDQLAQYLQLWEVVAATHLALDVPDTITWTINSEGDYFTGSAYHVQFLGSFRKVRC